GEKGPERLALGGDEVELAQRLRHPHDGGDAGEAADEGRGGGAQDVALQGAHGDGISTATALRKLWRGLSNRHPASEPAVPDSTQEYTPYGRCPENRVREIRRPLGRHRRRSDRRAARL